MKYKPRRKENKNINLEVKYNKLIKDNPYLSDEELCSVLAIDLDKLNEIGVEDYKKFNNHSLRHTHASVLLESGVNILTISKRLGHSTPATTQNVYLHIIKELEARDNKKILESI